MKKVLVTGGTVFVSRYIAEHYVRKHYDVYVLNRNTKPQSEGVRLIEADRHCLGDALKQHHFDVVIDVTAYNETDIHDLLDGLGSFDDYILISSSAVYPEHCAQPFSEDTPIGENRIWGAYGMGKVKAERALQARVPNAYILRPPYLYGPMNNVYREAFVFDCALQDRKFYLPGNGELGLQFFHVEDLCRFMDCLLERHPSETVYNVGNSKTVSAKEWVELCYQAAGKRPAFVTVDPAVEQRKYFSFYAYGYCLDVSKMQKLMSATIPLADGLRDAFAWYCTHADLVNKKPYIEYIDTQLADPTDEC